MANDERNFAIKRHDGPMHNKVINDFADARTRASAGSLASKIANAKQFNAGIDEMKKDAVNIFKQAFYEDEVTDNGDGTYTIVPDRHYDVGAIYKWDDNDTLTCKFDYSDNVLIFRYLSQHLIYDPKDGFIEGRWKGDEELENFLTDLAFEYENAMSA